MRPQPLIAVGDVLARRCLGNALAVFCGAY
jgi:hypothetical protein